MHDRDKLMLTRDAICSGLNTIKSAYERCEEDHDIVYFVGEYGTGQVAHSVSVPTLLSDAIELLKEHGWIPVTERLPRSVANKVLVYVQHEDYVGYIGYGHYEKYKGQEMWFDLEHYEEFSKRGYTVTHWMETPMPPMEGR